jgi:hypothetical protein
MKRDLKIGVRVFYIYWAQKLLIDIAARTTTIVIFASHMKEISGWAFASGLFASHRENM